MKTPEQAAKAWADSAGRAQANFTEGVNNYSGDWAGTTARQEAVMLQNLTQAVTSGRWRAGVERTGTGGWKTRTQAKAANFGVGFTAGASRQASAIRKIMAAEAAIVSSLPPRGTHEQNKARMNAVVDALHAQKGQLGA